MEVNEVEVLIVDGFQPFLRFYAVAEALRLKPSSTLFQPFLRFYEFVQTGSPTPIYMFQPFLRFYLR